MGRCWTCGEGACSRDGLTADADLTDAPQSKCGSWLACDGSLTADQDVGSDRVHIRSCGNGHRWFRSYSGSLLERPKSNQKAFAPPLGTSPAFGQRGLTGRFRSKARSRAARLASWLPSIASELCRYLWLSQASQLFALVLCQCRHAPGFARFTGFSPANAARRFSTAHLAIASRVSWVAEPICGVATTLFNRNNGDA